MPRMVKRIKLDSDTTGTTGAYLTTDLSDKNVIVDHTVPNIVIDTPEKLQAEYQKITQYENSDVDKNYPDYLMQRKINESYSKSR